MANYEYIIASLPAVSKDWKFAEGKSLDDYVVWIKERLGEKDIKTVDKLLDGFREECLNKEFYEAALSDANRFIREYFSFDLGFRNTKARFLNKVFGRPEDSDTIDIDGSVFEDAPKVEYTLSEKDLLTRERKLDAIRWEKISELVTFNYFDLDAILAVIAKMRLVERWRALDDETGRELFNRMIGEIINKEKQIITI